VAVDRALSSAFGEALVSLFDWAWPSARSTIDEVLEDVAEIVKPKPPMSIRTTDGETVTGLLVVDRGDVILFLGVREQAQSIITPPPRQRSPSPFDEPELWQRPIDPYARHP
jgi:hypothetical protein